MTQLVFCQNVSIIRPVNPVADVGQLKGGAECFFFWLSSNRQFCQRGLHHILTGTRCGAVGSSEIQVV